MKKYTSCMPNAAMGDNLVSTPKPRPLGKKRDVGVLAGGMSVRWVDSQLSKGMPHLKLGARRVRFDLLEVAAWLKEKYGERRIGSGNATKTALGTLGVGAISPEQVEDCEQATSHA